MNVETISAESHTKLMFKVFVEMQKGFKPVGNSYKDENNYYQDIAKT